MSLGVGFLELLNTQVCVDLRSTQLLVAKEFLYDSYVRSAVHNMRSKTMPQSVGAYLFLYSQLG